MMSHARSAALAALFLLALLATGCAGDDGDDGGVAPSDAGAPADTVSRDAGGVEAGPDDAGAADVAADGAVAPGPPACGSGSYAWRGLIPGPGEAGFDAALAARAEQFERSYRTFNAAAMGLNIDVFVDLERVDERAAIERYLRAEDGWDFEASSGWTPAEVITSYQKVAGLYAGVGIAADAFRYGVLRDQGYPCEDVDRARAALLASLETLHLAVAITGAEGVIARGLHRRDLPGGGHYETVPLFDEDGAPLPQPKSNGTWREDFSEGGQYEGWIWEDSVSRDQYVGWVAGFAGAWEVIRDDPTVPQDVRDRLRGDALALARELMVVRESGYDLEIPDADGRTTLHGWLNEHNLDGQLYLPTIQNGFHATMAIGIVAAWVYVTDDPALRAWLEDDLIGERRLHEIVRDRAGLLVHTGHGANFSNHNMAFTGALLAVRYLENEEALAAVREGLADQLYAQPGAPWQPVEYEYALFDLTYAAGMAEATAFAPAPDPAVVLQEDALASALRSLRGFPEPPYWNVGVQNCPDAACTEEEPEVADPSCTAPGGLALTVLGCIGWKGDLVTEEPIPMALRGPSNYHWRSNPYEPNRDGSGAELYPGVDFRIAYWFGRWARRGDAPTP